MVQLTPSLEQQQGSGSEWRVWEASGIAVRLSSAVIERIERQALARFRAITERGSEIGGLLLGRVSGDLPTVTIEDHELVPCDFTRGPFYQLSEQDEQRLAAAVAQRRDPLVVVGFFRSNTRTELALDSSDLALLDRCFPGPEKLALLVKPFSMKPSICGIFLRAGGQFQAKPPSIEFVLRRGENTTSAPAVPAAPPAPKAPVAPPQIIEPPKPPEPPPEPLSESRVADDLRALAETATPPAAPAPEIAPEPPAPARGSKRWLWMPLAAAALFVGGAYLGRFIDLPTPAAKSAAGGPLALQVERRGGQLRLRWNQSAAVLAQAQKATLTIIDGARRQDLALDLDQVRTGSLVYAPTTGDVTFRLEVADLEHGKSLTESIRAVSDRPSPLGPPLAAPEPQEQAPPPEAQPPAVAPAPTEQPKPTPPPAVAAPTTPPAEVTIDPPPPPEPVSESAKPD
jgi:hypothetical protein